VTVIAVAGDHLVAIHHGHLHADNDGFLPDIEVAEPADEAHAVKLAGLFFKAADQKHLAVGPFSPLFSAGFLRDAAVALLRVAISSSQWCFEVTIGKLRTISKRINA
jgi:hypothetical protein